MSKQLAACAASLLCFWGPAAQCLGRHADAGRFLHPAHCSHCRICAGTSCRAWAIAIVRSKSGMQADDPARIAPACIPVTQGWGRECVKNAASARPGNSGAGGGFPAWAKPPAQSLAERRLILRFSLWPLPNRAASAHVGWDGGAFNGVVHVSPRKRSTLITPKPHRRFVVPLRACPPFRLGPPCASSWRRAHRDHARFEPL